MLTAGSAAMTMTMREITADKDLVAFCGLYCGACRAYLKGRCPGCHENAKAKWCKVRSCCIERQLGSCADCTDHADPNTCASFNNVFSKLFGLVLNSDRKACVAQIREVGAEEHARLMASRRRQSLPRR
jgi:hypothetical protein